MGAKSAGQLAALALLVAALGACASPSPPEYAAYNAAWSAAGAANDRFVQVWAPMEVRQTHAIDRTTFDPAKARYEIDGGIGDSARQIMAGFDAVESYNRVLARYLSGESTTEVLSDLSRSATAVTGIVATAGGPIAGPSVAAAGQIALEALGAVLSVSDRQEFRRAVAENTPLVLEFLDRVIGTASPSIYGWALTTFALDDRLTPEERAMRLLQFRKALANWVVLLQEAREATLALSGAVASERSGQPTRAMVASWTEDIQRRADTIRALAIVLGGGA